MARPGPERIVATPGVLGVTQDGERFEVSGVAEPDMVQNDFLSVLHADGKVSHDVEVTEHRLVHDGLVVLAFHVAEIPRTGKPVYLDGDIRRTFPGRGGGDDRAQPHELERLLRDASEDRWDSQPLPPHRCWQDAPRPPRRRPLTALPQSRITRRPCLASRPSPHLCAL